MQFPQASGRTQLPLFHTALLNAASLARNLDQDTLTRNKPAESFSEIALSGSQDNCLLLLKPILRELSELAGDRWLTLIDAPVQLNQVWLRHTGINRERILLLQSRSGQTPVELACQALRLARSHTVVSWINPLDTSARQWMTRAATQGNSHSLNIRLG